MRRPPDAKEKVESGGNQIRPDEPAPSKENDSQSSMAERVETVKRVEPWLTLGLLRDDLKQIRAFLEHRELDAGNGELALRRALRALQRIGDGELSAEGWAR
jgi:hypothetical protein